MDEKVVNLLNVPVLKLLLEMRVALRSLRQQEYAGGFLIYPMYDAWAFNFSQFLSNTLGLRIFGNKPIGNTGFLSSTISMNNQACWLVDG